MNLFPVYKVLAYFVGSMLAFCSFVAFPLSHFTEPGTTLNHVGELLSWLWMIHGFGYMAYFVVAFVMAVNARWERTFVILMLAAGIIPLLMFWVEGRVEDRVRADEEARSSVGAG